MLCHNSFKRIIILVIIVGKGRKQSCPQGSYLGSPVTVAYGVLQDTLKQHRPLGDRAVAVFFREPHHGILDDVQCGFFVSNGKHGLFEGPAFDAGKEIGKFDSSTQGRLLPVFSSFS